MRHRRSDPRETGLNVMDSVRESQMLADACQHMSANRECLVGFKLNRNKL
jgi:hypothetical protein